MDPLTIAILGSAAAGAAGNYFGQQEAGRAATKASDKAMAQENALRQQALEMIQQGMDPAELQGLYDIGAYSPEEFQVIEGFDPIAYQYGGDIDPTLIEDSPEARAMQMDALGQMQERVDEGLTAEDKTQFMLGQLRTGEAARGREEAIMQSLQERGMGGSGIEASLRQQASQDAIEQLALQQAIQAQSAASERANATSQMFGAAGNLRGQDIGLSQSNAGIINDLALENSRRQQEINNMNISQQNAYYQDLTNQKRAVSEQNVAQRNQAQMETQNRARQNLMDIYGANADYSQLQAGSMLGGVEGIRAQGAANAQADAAKWQALGQVPGAIGGSYIDYQTAKARQPQPIQQQQQQQQQQQGQVPPAPRGY